MALSGFEHFSTIHRLVSELVRHFNTESNIQDERVNDINIKSLMEYICEYTLSSTENGTLSRALSRDSFHLLRLCQDRIGGRYNNPQFSQFLHLYNQLGSSAFSDKFIIFLLLLSNRSNEETSPHRIRLIDYPNLLEPYLPPDPVSLKSAIPANALSPLASPHSPTESHSPIILTTEGEETSLASYNLLENSLVSDLIENLQGRDGIFIRTASKLVNGSPQIEVTTSPSIPTSLLRRCMSVLPLACSFLHIQLLTDQMSHASSLISCSLVAAVRSHMEEYAEYVSLYSDLETGACSLRSLLLYVHEPMYCVPRVCALLESWQRLGDGGGALVNLVYRATFSGCERMRGILRQFLAELMVPLQSLLHRWVCLGEIELEQKDFFIKSNQNTSEDIWDRGYEICNANLLDFISQQLACKILITGKAVSFMRLVCEEPSENFCSAETLFNTFSLSFETILNGTFDNIIYEMYRVQSAHLMRILEHNFQFRVHLRGFRDFFLMTRGDFSFSFLTQAKHLLDSPAAHIETRELNHLYYLSLQSTTAKKIPRDVKDRFEVELFSGSQGEIGWNVLSLNYILTPPLDTVFPTSTIQAYQSIYRVVLNIRKNEFILVEIWRRLSLYFKQVPDELSLSHFFYTSNLYMCCMLHFVKNIQFYICDLFTSQWQEFSNALDGCTDLDQLRATHFRYLDLLRASCYLVSPQNVIHTNLIKHKYLHILTDLNSMFLTLLGCIALAKDTFQNCFSDLDLEIIARQQTEERIESGDWGMTDSLEQKGVERTNEFMNRMQLTHQEIKLQYRNFNHKVHTFVVHIYKNPILNLRRLAVDLNFNGFYKSNTFT